MHRASESISPGPGAGDSIVHARQRGPQLTEDAGPSDDEDPAPDPLGLEVVAAIAAAKRGKTSVVTAPAGDITEGREDVDKMRPMIEGQVLIGRSSLEGVSLAGRRTGSNSSEDGVGSQAPHTAAPQPRTLQMIARVSLLAPLSRHSC